MHVATNGNVRPYWREHVRLASVVNSVHVYQWHFDASMWLTQFTWNSKILFASMPLYDGGVVRFCILIVVQYHCHAYGEDVCFFILFV